MSALDIAIDNYDSNSDGSKLVMIGFKAPSDLKVLLDIRAKQNNTTVSNLVRTIVETSFITDRLQSVVVNNVKKGVALILSVSDLFDWESAKQFVDKIFDEGNDRWPPSSAMGMATS